MENVIQKVKNELQKVVLVQCRNLEAYAGRKRAVKGGKPDEEGKRGSGHRFCEREGAVESGEQAGR